MKQLKDFNETAGDLNKIPILIQKILEFIWVQLENFQKKARSVQMIRLANDLD